jgi:hypothetical protein
VEYLREMRTYGFQGLVLVLRYCDHAPIVRDGNGRWMAPASVLVQPETDSPVLELASGGRAVRWARHGRRGAGSRRRSSPS